MHRPLGRQARDGSKETADAENDIARRTLSQDLNRHAAVVLEGRALGSMSSCCLCYLIAMSLLFVSKANKSNISSFLYKIKLSSVAFRLVAFVLNAVKQTNFYTCMCAHAHTYIPMQNCGISVL